MALPSGSAALADFAMPGIVSVADLANEEPDALYRRLCQMTHARHDPCVHDVFTAAIHQARTGEAHDWWRYSAARKSRQRQGTFPANIL